MIDKIKRLLALSHSGNEHEAARALESAMRLAAKNGLNIQDIKGTEFAGDIGFGDAIYPRGCYRCWELVLFGGIAKVFGCRLVRAYRSLLFVGTKADTELAEYVGVYLARELRLLAKNHTPKLARRERGGFLYGAARRVLESANAMFRQEASESEQQAYGLVVKRGVLAAEFLKDVPAAKHKFAKASRKGVVPGYAAGGLICIRKSMERKSAENLSIE